MTVFFFRTFVTDSDLSSRAVHGRCSNWKAIWFHFKNRFESIHYIVRNGFNPRICSPLERMTLLEEKRHRCVIAFLLSDSFFTGRTRRALETFCFKRNKYRVTKTGSSDSRDESRASSNLERQKIKAIASGEFLIDSTWNGLTSLSTNSLTSWDDIPQFSSKLLYCIKGRTKRKTI